MPTARRNMTGDSMARVSKIREQRAVDRMRGRRGRRPGFGVLVVIVVTVVGVTDAIRAAALRVLKTKSEGDEFADCVVELRQVGEPAVHLARRLDQGLVQPFGHGREPLPRQRAVIELPDLGLHFFMERGHAEDFSIVELQHAQLELQRIGPPLVRGHDRGPGEFQAAGPQKLAVLETVRRHELAPIVEQVQHAAAEVQGHPDGGFGRGNRVDHGDALPVIRERRVHEDQQSARAGVVECIADGEFELQILVALVDDFEFKVSIFGRDPQILQQEFGQNAPSSRHGVQHARADLVRLPVIVVPQAIGAQVVIQIPGAVVELCGQER